MPEVNDTYRFACFQQLGGQTVMNVLYFNTITAAYAGADFTTLATDVKEAFRVPQSGLLTYRNWRAVQVRGDGVSPIQAECKTEGGLTFEGNYTSQTAGGGGTGAYLPPQSALVITLNTGQTGRRRRGRIYLGGYEMANQSSGTWGGTHITAVTNAFQTFWLKYATASATSTVFRLGVWSGRIATGCERDPNPPYKMKNIETPNLDDAWRLCTAYLVRTTVFTQRRRVLGVGR